MTTTVCPLCGIRKGRRSCPALGQRICAVCCGTKRIVEIACPADCAYLESSRQHPPAVAQRRQERDVTFLASMVQGLSERQYRLLLFLQAFIKRYAPATVPAIVDDDVAEAAAALAATTETASRGIIYEHPASSLPAQRLMMEMRAAIEGVAHEAQRPMDRDVAAALRGIERAARDARRVLNDGEKSYLGVIDRMMRERPAQDEKAPKIADGSETEASRLIIP